MASLLEFRICSLTLFFRCHREAHKTDLQPEMSNGSFVRLTVVRDSLNRCPFREHPPRAPFAENDGYPTISVFQPISIKIQSDHSPAFPGETLNDRYARQKLPSDRKKPGCRAIPAYSSSRCSYRASVRVFMNATSASIRSSSSAGPVVSSLTDSVDGTSGQRHG